jgi:hypothetical protein
MYKALKGLASFEVGQLLIKSSEHKADEVLASELDRLNEYYIVQEIQQDKIVLKKATIVSERINYSIEEMLIKSLFVDCCWYIKK